MEIHLLFLTVVSVKKLLDGEFVNKPLCACVLLDNEEDITDIHSDGALKLRLEGYIARHRLPVAVEGKTDKLTLRVHNGRARVTTRNIAVYKECYGEVAILIGIAAIILLGI
mgnify:CR=1 FL=1